MAQRRRTAEVSQPGLSPDTPRPVAVLASGGVDSAVLVADQSRQGRVVQPIYVRFGLAWEAVEEAHLRRFLDTLPPASVLPLVVLEEPVADVYGAHWSVSGADVPDEDTPDSARIEVAKPRAIGLLQTLHGSRELALGQPPRSLQPDPPAELGVAVEGNEVSEVVVPAAGAV